VFYGYTILAISTVALAATSPGQSYLVGRFNQSIEQALGISETTLSACYGVATFLAAIPLLYVGKLADRHGPRIVMGCSALALGAACWAIGFAQGPISLTVCYFLLRFAGQGALGLSASHSVAMWFERKLGRVNGVKGFAMPFAIASFPWLIGLAGVAVWIAVLPLVIFLHRNKPEDIGQRVDGDAPRLADSLRSSPIWGEDPPKADHRRPGQGPPGSPNADHRHPHAHPDAELIASAATEQPLAIDLEDDPPILIPGEPAYTRAQALRTRSFWIITSAMIANALIGTAFVFLLDDLAEGVNLPDGSAATLLAVFAVCSAM